MNQQLIELILNLLPAAIDAVTRLHLGMQILKQAQEEGWADDDPRWVSVFQHFDTDLDKAESAL